MITTPNVMGVRAYVNRTTDKQDVIFVCPTPETYKSNFVKKYPGSYPRFFKY